MTDNIKMSRFVGTDKISDPGKVRDVRGKPSNGTTKLPRQTLQDNGPRQTLIINAEIKTKTPAVQYGGKFNQKPTQIVSQEKEMRLKKEIKHPNGVIMPRGAVSTGRRTSTGSTNSSDSSSPESTDHLEEEILAKIGNRQTKVVNESKGMFQPKSLLIW